MTALGDRNQALEGTDKWYRSGHVVLPEPPCHIARGQLLSETKHALLLNWPWPICAPYLVTVLTRIKPISRPQYTKASRRDTTKLPTPTRHDPGEQLCFDARIATISELTTHTEYASIAVCNQSHEEFFLVSTRMAVSTTGTGRSPGTLGIGQSVGQLFHVYYSFREES
jgi:hypothetical protein